MSFLGSLVGAGLKQAFGSMGTGIGMFGKEGGFLSDFGTGEGALQSFFGGDKEAGKFGKLGQKLVKGFSTNQDKFGQHIQKPNINPAPSGGGVSGSSMLGQNILNNLVPGMKMFGDHQANQPFKGMPNLQGAINALTNNQVAQGPQNYNAQFGNQDVPNPINQGVNQYNQSFQPNTANPVSTGVADYNARFGNTDIPNQINQGVADYNARFSAPADYTQVDVFNNREGFGG